MAIDVDGIVAQAIGEGQRVVGPMIREVARRAVCLGITAGAKACANVAAEIGDGDRRKWEGAEQREPYTSNRIWQCGQNIAVACRAIAAEYEKGANHDD